MKLRRRHKEPRKPRDWRKFRRTLANILVILSAPALAILLTLYVFQSYEVDGQSMETTLSNHDRLIVLKAPQTIAHIKGEQYMPNRGDVIIFKKRGLHGLGSLEDEKQLIKRVIGLPGDHVVLDEGVLTIYNAEHPGGYDPDAGNEWANTMRRPILGRVDITVKDNEVFVCGDNRANSTDSRVFGSIETKDIVGKLGARVFPLGSFKIF